MYMYIYIYIYVYVYVRVCIYIISNIIFRARSASTHAAVLRLGIPPTHVLVLPLGHRPKVPNPVVHLRVVEAASVVLVEPPLRLPVCGPSQVARVTDAPST